jgi:hypothetical protein
MNIRKVIIKMKEIRNADSFSDIWQNCLTEDERNAITVQTENLKREIKTRDALKAAQISEMKKYREEKAKQLRKLRRSSKTNESPKMRVH